MRVERINSPVVSLAEVSKIFGSNSHTTAAVRDVTLQFSLGELVVLLGPSGSGKTTLLTLIAGLIEPTWGRVTLFGEDVVTYPTRKLQELRAQRLGFVFQDFLLIDSLTAMENVAMVLRFAGSSKFAARRQAKRLLEDFHIAHLTDKYPDRLSQGEKQRVAIARAIANDADLIIADEPTASLESTQGFDIIQLLHRYAKERNKCVIVATHDLRIVDLADRVLRLEDGMIGAHRTESK